MSTSLLFLVSASVTFIIKLLLLLRLVLFKGFLMEHVYRASVDSLSVVGKKIRRTFHYYLKKKNVYIYLFINIDIYHSLAWGPRHNSCIENARRRGGGEPKERRSGNGTHIRED